MTDADLRTFSRLYRSSSYMGADSLFRRFYALPEDTVVPLSVSHGVDFGHCYWPMDVISVEPVHWSCNPLMHERAQRYKPSLLAPHPWVMLLGGREPAPGKGVLVIGPPPSPENDAALYALIKKDVGRDWSILVKARGSYEPSMRYWASVGLRPLTAKGPDSNFYERLGELLSGFHTIIGCTFSSALVFAASIGKEVRLVRGYAYSAYELSDYEVEINLASDAARAVVRTFANGNQAEIRQLAQHLLGFDLLDTKKATLAEFRRIISELPRPFWNDPSLRIPYRLREAAAMTLNKPAILRAGFHTYLQRLRRANACIMRINDVDVWLNGKNERNFRLTPVTYVRGVTEPGFAPGGYQ